MKNVVSIETARKLKNAGFPQPEPEAGQAWYTKSEMLFVVARAQGKEVAVGWPHCEDPFSHLKKHVFETCIFAPTATDILPELEGEYFLDFDTETEDFFALKSLGPTFSFGDKKGCEALADAYFRMFEIGEVE